LSAKAAKAATSETPIVFLAGQDPVSEGLVKSLNRPGGNVTGVTVVLGELETKRLQLLHEIVPAAHSVGYLVNPNTGPVADLGTAATKLGVELHTVGATSVGELDRPARS
jgi:putative ABC transport system substrate-binding protein